MCVKRLEMRRRYVDTRHFDIVPRYVRGAWVKTMDSASGQDRWSQIGFGNFHFAQGNCATEHTSSWATDAFSNEGVFPEDKGVGGADWRNPVVQQFWRGHFGNGGPPSPGLCVVGAYEYKHYPCSKGFEGSCKEKNVLSPKHRWANYYGQICGEGTVLSREGLGLCMDEYSNKVDTKLEQVGDLRNIRKSLLAGSYRVCGDSCRRSCCGDLVVGFSLPVCSAKTKSVSLDHRRCSCRFLH